MLKFIEELKENGTITELSYNGYNHRVFKHIPFDLGNEISVQASVSHYCLPRQTIDLEKYSHMELAFIRNNVFITAERFVSKELYNRLKRHECNNIYSFVPVELIEETYQYLMNNYRYKKFNKHNGSKI